MTERDRLHGKIREAIGKPLSIRERDTLLRDVASWQARKNEVFGKLASNVDFRQVESPLDWPAVPTDLFRYARVACFPEGEEVRVFRTSGTTSGARGAHPFRDLSLYELAAKTMAERALFIRRNMHLVLLAPHPEQAKDSSLSFMFGCFEEWFGNAGATWCWKDGKLDIETLAKALDRPDPVALLGTSFAFVMAESELGERQWTLPDGSMIMTTGGFKGKTREIDPDDMKTMLGWRYGVSNLVSEYGMTELSSQMYDWTGTLIVPDWVLATPVHPETLRPVAEGETGILRIDDLANLDSVVSIQTADLAAWTEDGLVLMGRSPDATPRGCSLAIEEALGRTPD